MANVTHSPPPAIGQRIWISSRESGPPSTMCFVSDSVRCEVGAAASSERISSTGLRRSSHKYEKLWRELFLDPSLWWDNRLGKPNPRFPDFKHKQTGVGLWLSNAQNPPWVSSQIASIAPKMTVFSRAKKLSIHNKARQYEKTLQEFELMQQEGITGDGYSFVHVLNACAALKDLEAGRRIHRRINETLFDLNIRVSSSLVDMYAKCENIDEARKVFDKMPTRDVVVWTAMIFGCVKCGEGQMALELFQQMQQEGIEPNSVTFVGLIKSCASLGALEEGRRVHEQVIRSHLDSDLYVGCSLIDMYTKSGCIDDARKVFDRMPAHDVVVWSAMILGCVKCGHGPMALALFQEMLCEGIKPDSLIYVGLLNVCTSMGALGEGKRFHQQIIQSGLESNMYIRCSLIDMYAKCGSIDDAWIVFDKMPTRNVVAWNGMILGFVNFGRCLKALELFQQMQREGVEPDPVSFVGVLNACAKIAALEEGRRIHQQIIRSGCESNSYVCNSLVDMYSKCGSIQEARTVFDSMPKCTVVGWNAMIMGYAMNGNAGEAVAVFELMCGAGVNADEVTFICLLSACSHGGLVTKGLQYFETMTSVHDVSPTIEHYTCIIDLLGRTGRLQEAEKILLTMPLEPCPAAWLSLLAGCRVHGNMEIGERAAKRILELDPQNLAGYVLLSNIYAAAGHWDSKAFVQERRNQKILKKQPGRTWIEVNHEVHSFAVNDCQHPQIVKIHEELARLFENLTKSGYTPDTRFSLHDVEEEKKIEHLGRHSEKLAIAFGLMSTPAGTPLRIVKNLRVCGDCHTATKLIARIFEREITVRDGNRFHHFKDGICSCGDYW